MGHPGAAIPGGLRDRRDERLLEEGQQASPFRDAVDLVVNALPVSELTHVVLCSPARTVGQPLGTGLRADIGCLGKPAETAGVTTSQRSLDRPLHTEPETSQPRAAAQPPQYCTKH